jgi:hypothetical protein
MTNVTAGAYADMPLFLFHLLEYLDLDYEIDVDDINERWSRESAVDVWSQIVLKETSPTVDLLTAAPRSGVYRLAPDGTADFLRPAWDWHGIHRESAACCAGRRWSRCSRPPRPGSRSSWPERYSGPWLTASTLLPSGSRTNAP